MTNIVDKFIEIFYSNLIVRWALSLLIISILYILISSHYKIETQLYIGYGSAILLFSSMFFKKLPEWLILFIKILATIVVLR